MSLAGDDLEGTARLNGGLRDGAGAFVLPLGAIKVKVTVGASGHCRKLCRVLLVGWHREDGRGASFSRAKSEDVQRFSDLAAWERSHLLILGLHRFAATYPAEDRYGLVSRLRRKAVSVPRDTAAGSKRDSNLDTAPFLNAAESSLAEMDLSQLRLHRLGRRVVSLVAAQPRRQLHSGEQAGRRMEDRSARQGSAVLLGTAFRRTVVVWGGDIPGAGLAAARK